MLYMEYMKYTVIITKDEDGYYVVNVIVNMINYYF